MNVGILTYHWVSNFGANLQALSTYSYLEKSGHNPIIINWIPEDLEDYYNKSVIQEQNEYHRIFAEHHFKSITAKCRTDEEIADAILKNEIDLILVGSDAVFTYSPFLKRFHICRRGIVYSKPLHDSDFPNPYWGSFINKVPESIKLCAISASAQNTHYKYILNKKAFAKAISRYSYLSVRDIWTQKMISFLTNGHACPLITPDPVFAFEQNVGETLSKEYIINKFSLKNQYVIVSVSDKQFTLSWYSRLYELFEQKGYELVSLEQTTKSTAHGLPHHISLPIDPIEWYTLIKYSSGYIGELMHPILVSLHNAVPVYAIDNYGFRKGKSLDVLSSKTYQILLTFDLLSNYYNRKLNRILSPNDVVTALFNFDQRKCRENASRMLTKYNEMMENVLSI